ncbi:MAG: CHAT domain-containing protein [Chloroflexota bacterium]
MSNPILYELSQQIAQLLLPFLPDLLRGERPAGRLVFGEQPELARQVWERMAAPISDLPELAYRLGEIADAPGDPRALALLSWELEKLMQRLGAPVIDDLVGLLNAGVTQESLYTKGPLSGAGREKGPGETTWRSIEEPAEPGGEELYRPDASGGAPPDPSGMAYTTPFTAPPAAASSERPILEAPILESDSYLRAEITERPDDQPLPLDQESTLAILVDTEGGGSAVSFDRSRLFQKGEQIEELNVHLASQDFTLHTRSPQVLRLRPQGRSRNKARFDIEPKQAGPAEATALIYKDNNFIQGMSVRMNVAEAPLTSGQPPIDSVESLGRPLDGFTALQPRDALLFIKNNGASFDLTLVGPVAAEARLPFTLQALSEKIAAARNALQQVVWLAQGPDELYVHPSDQPVTDDVILPYQADVYIPYDVNQRALQILARAGYMLYHDLFYSPAASLEARNIGNKLLELTRSGSIHLQIVSQEFFLPWGLLYVAPRFDPQNIEPEYFLGMKHVIEHIPLQVRMPVMDNRISSQPRLSVSANLDPDIDLSLGLEVVARQMDFWQTASQKGRVDLQVRQTPEALQQALAQAGETSDQILYYYGHAESDPADAQRSKLLFAGQAPLALEDLLILGSEEQQLAGQPLVFINACESAELSPLFYSGFMPYFVDKGARGMIGTECQTPAVFAAEWARRFFKRFLEDGQPLGEAFLDLRREFYTRHNNLLGLVYALYCDGDTRVEPKLGKL